MDLGVYHQDLSKGNVLVCQQDGFPHPLLNDFDHTHLHLDDRNDSVHSPTGMVPFMSILNLAGCSQSHSIADELESFLYLWVWKCLIGFSPSHIIHPNTASNTPQSFVASIPQRITQMYVTSHKLSSLAQRRKFLLKEAKQPSVQAWAKGDLEKSCLNAKLKDTSSDIAFSVALQDLLPEFKDLKSLLLVAIPMCSSDHE
ncbi:hypothetical protein IWQ61_005839 [Dispira simplex]|nr:hypothetical protein IWQ61_005839 [Dispira simplex]